MTLGKNVKRLRIKAGLNQKDFSILSDIKLSTLCEIELGKRVNPTLVVLKKLSKAFNVSIDEIVDD